MAPPSTPIPRKKVAIVGSGVAGIGALWALNRTHHDVYIYEAADRLGGHTNTVEYKHGRHKVMVDAGFMVLNTETYPNFIAFLKALNVSTVPTDMSFGLSRDRGSFEWGGTSLAAVFAQRKNIFSPRMWRMLFDIVRFNHFAPDLLREERKSEGKHSMGNGTTNGVHYVQEQETIGQYLEREGYSDAFRDDYLIPLTAAIWSTSPEKCTQEIPAAALVRFMCTHHLLTTLTTKPRPSTWLTLQDGAQSYIDAAMRGFPPNHIFLCTPISAVTNDPDGRVRLHVSSSPGPKPKNSKSSSEQQHLYDHVILATHASQALSLLSPSASSTELEILSSFKTTKNTALLHSDVRLMPKIKKCCASVNCLTESPISVPGKGRRKGEIEQQVSVTYDLNTIQGIPRDVFGHVLVSLNPLQLPAPESVQGRYRYDHLLYNGAAVRAQGMLDWIQNQRGISYAGAWTRGWGTHEDGFVSGIKVAREDLGAVVLLGVGDSTDRKVIGERRKRRRGLRMRVRDVVFRLLVLIVQMVIEILEGMKVRRRLGRESREFGWVLEDR